MQFRWRVTKVVPDDNKYLQEGVEIKRTLQYKEDSSFFSSNAWEDVYESTDYVYINPELFDKIKDNNKKGKKNA